MELPGIEPDTKIALTSGNAGSEYAKRRESTQKTCGYAKGVDCINTTKRLYFEAKTISWAHPRREPSPAFDHAGLNYADAVYMYRAAVVDWRPRLLWELAD